MNVDNAAKILRISRQAFYSFVGFLCVFLLLFGLKTSVFAAENIIIYPDAQHISLSGSFILHEPSANVKVETVRPQDGENQFLEVSSGDDSSPQWISFALTNPSDTSIQRLLIAPHYGGGNDGLIMPILGGSRISQLFASSGLKPSLQNINGSDVFLINLPADRTITYVARIADNIPTSLSLWDVNSYNSHQNYLPFYHGLIIGILGLLAIIISSLFVVRRELIFVVAALICWASLGYTLQEFGFITVILPDEPFILSLARAVSEVTISGLPLLLIYLFFNKTYRLDGVQIIILSPLFVAFIALILAFISPSMAATVARLNAVFVTLMGFWLIIRHWPTAKFSTAQTLLPIWFIFSLWTAAQIYFAVSPETLYLNLLVGAIYLLFLLMCFIALLQDFTSAAQPAYIESAPRSITPSKPIAENTSGSQAQSSNIPNIAIAGSGQALWEWDLLEGMVNCGTELDDLLHFPHGTMSTNVNSWVEFLHMRDIPKFESVLAVILEDGNSRIDQDIRLRNAAGEFLWFELRAVALTDEEGYLVSFVGTLNEVTLRKATVERLLQDAVHDNLTGLPNRSLFIDRLAQAIVRSDDKKPALILIDLDRFKALNDNIGIAGGDSILMIVARRLEKFIKGSDTIARLNADRFAIILTDYSDLDYVMNFAEKMRKIIASPLSMESREIVLNCSVGIVLVETGKENADEILHKAELALRSAKQMDKASVIAYTSDLGGRGGDWFTRENDLRQAIARNEFEMLYQPIISLETMRPVGFEALIRWHHPLDGYVLPSDFIQLAEETGHIHALGQFSLVEAAKQLNIWQRTFSHGEPLFVSVNMSSLQLFQPKLVEQVQDVLTRFNLVNQTLKLEITESLVMKNPELASQILERLKEIGTGLAIDDFGTGYSSLSYLHQFPFDVIKIDQSFVNGENLGETRPIILKAIIKLARDLGLKVVAEGVEKDEQAHELIDLGCEWVQGYRFGEPMTAKESLNFLSANFI